MKIVAWNCKMALGRKRQHLYDLHPDIAVIPECSKDHLELCAKDGFDGRWFGDNPLKGLGVLVAKPLQIARTGKPPNRWVAPLWISGGPYDFLLIAVWAMRVKGSLVRSYIGQDRNKKPVVATDICLVHCRKRCHVGQTGFSPDPSVALNDLISSL